MEINYEDGTSPEEMRNIISEWQTVIQTQMHFNDMVMKLRTAIISVAGVIFGLSAYSLQNQELIFNVKLLTLDLKLHISIFTISGGVIILFVTFLVDYFYYYRMLVGAVKRGYQFDREFNRPLFTWNDNNTIGPRLLAFLNKKISRSITEIKENNGEYKIIDKNNNYLIMKLNKNLGIVDILDSNNNPLLQLQAIWNEENCSWDVYYKHRYFGLSLDIRNAIGKPGKSKWYVLIFYLFPITLGMITIYAIICMFNPDLGWCIKLHA